MKQWKITWKHEKAVGRHADGHPMYPDEWVPSLSLVEAIKKDPSPCDSCARRTTCGENELACRDFYIYVHAYEYGYFSRGVKKVAKYHFEDREEGPNRTWYGRLYG